MGIRCFNPSSSRYERNVEPSYSRHDKSPSSSRYDTNPKLPNPDPSNYKIMMAYQQNEYLLVTINYPDCTNYEGNKVLLFKGVDMAGLSRQNSIDPHFCKNKKYYSPIARFEPTPFGWDCGLRLINALCSKG